MDKTKEHKKREFARYPKYRAMYVKAFDKMLKHRAEIGRPSPMRKTGEDVMNRRLDDNPDLLTLFDDPGGDMI